MTRQLIRFVVAAGLTLASWPNSASAQSTLPYPVVSGSRVRLEAPTMLAGQFEGTVREIDDQSMLIELANRAAIRVPRQAISHLDVSVGRRRQFLKGAMIGAGIGAVLYGLASDGVEEWGVTKSQFVAAGLTGGAVWGVAIGAFVKTERWAAVPVSPAPVSSAASHRRTVLTLASVRF